MKVSGGADRTPGVQSRNAKRRRVVPPKIRGHRIDQREKNFIREYLVDFNGTAAAIRAGYPKKGAHDAANRLLKSDVILEAFHKYQNTYECKTLVTRKRIIEELARIGFSDLTKFVVVKHRKTYIRDTDTLPKHLGCCIQEIWQTKEGIRIKLYDKQKALELLGKYLGMWLERHEVGGAAGNPVRIYLPENARPANGLPQTDTGKGAGKQGAKRKGAKDGS